MKGQRAVGWFCSVDGDGRKGVEERAEAIATKYFESAHRALARRLVLRSAVEDFAQARQLKQEAHELLGLVIIRSVVRAPRKPPPAQWISR